MATVRVEIWAWLPIPKLKLEEVKKQIIFQEQIFPGISALDLFNKMAAQHKYFRKFIFDRESQKFNFHVSVVINEIIAKVSELSKTYLKDGDRIIIIPLAAGG